MKKQCRRRKSITGFVFASIISIITVAAATGAANPASVYRIAFMDMGQPGPYTTISYIGPQWVLSSMLFDTLTWKSSRGTIPWLATSWSVSSNHRVWIMTIRKGVTFSNGQPLTAHDVAFSFRYLLQHPELLTMGASAVREYVASVSSRGTRTVVFQLRAPYAHFLNQVAGEVPIVPASIWQPIKHPLQFLGNPNSYIGTGPYRLQSYQPGQDYVFTARHRYWAGRQKVTTVVFDANVNPVLGIMGKTVDAAQIDSRRAISFAKRMGYRVVTGPPSYAAEALVFNTSVSPFNSTMVRRGLMEAINRRQMLQVVGDGFGVLGSPGLIPPGSRWYDSHLTQIPYNLTQAKTFLATQGLTERHGQLLTARGVPLNVTLWFRNDPTTARLATMIAKDWQLLGITVTAIPETTPVFAKRVVDGHFSVALGTFGGLDNPDVPALMPDFPWRGFHDTKLVRLDRAYDLAASGPTARQAADAIQSRLAQVVPSLILYYPNTAVVERPGAVQWFWTPNGLGGGAPIWWNKEALISADVAPTAFSVSSNRGPSGRYWEWAVGAAAILGGVITWRRLRANPSKL